MKKINLTLLLFLIVFSLFAEGKPDYHTDENSISASTIALGGSQITNYNDAFCSYYNPAMLAVISSGRFGVGFKVRVNSGSLEENFKASKILSKGKINAIYLEIPKGSFHYTPLVDVKAKSDEFISENIVRKKYLKFQLSSLGFSATHKTTNLYYGLSFKYIYGRKVYNNVVRNEEENIVTKTDFYDRKVNGFTTDFGFFYKYDSITSSLVFYDLFSKLYWEGASDKSIVRRFAFGSSYGLEKYKVHFSVSKKLKWGSRNTFHFGYEQLSSFNAKRIKEVIVRVGTFSENFYNRDKIGFSAGIGLPYQTYSFELAWKIMGLKSNTSEIYLGFKMGFAAG